MQKKISLKKKLNNILLKKKLELNKFSLVLKNKIKIKKNYNQNFFTKIVLKMKLIKTIANKNILHYPLKFYFFKKFDIYNNFIKKNLKFIIIIKIQKYILKKKNWNIFLLSKNQIHFLNYNYLFFFN